MFVVNVLLIKIFFTENLGLDHDPDPDPDLDLIGIQQNLDPKADSVNLESETPMFSLLGSGDGVFDCQLRLFRNWQKNWSEEERAHFVQLLSSQQ
jgi:hypothetical protein